MSALAIVVVAVLWAFSGVLSLAETAFTRASRIRLLAREEEGDKRARRVLRLLEHPEQTLNSILLLLLGCQMIGATILGTVLEPSLGAAGIAIGIVTEIFVVFTLFEVVPEVMLPRTDMVAVEADATVDEAIRNAIEAGKSRLPAYEDTTDNIVGLVFLKDLVARSAAGQGAEPVRESLRHAHFVPESKRVAELLREMQTEKFHSAIVVDGYGGTAGLVTMEDLLEEIVGEITDEYDLPEPAVELLASGALRVPGRTPIDEVNELLDVDLPQEEWDTVGGLVFNTLGHVPIEGECVRVDGLEFCAERVQGRRIVSVIITRLVAPRGEENEETPATADRAE